MLSPLIVIAQLEAKPALSARCRAALEPLITATQQEPGCLRYQLYQSRDNPHAWMLHEEWENEEALIAHQQLPHFLAFVTQTQDWFASSTVRRYHLA